MKVFISHTFQESDQKLASILNERLKIHEIEGYIAERKKEYELLIRDKIKNQIQSSDYLVAIITEFGLNSASVHEEIGYAIGIDVPVILMVAQNVKEKGVLIYGKEPEYFDTKSFEKHADNIVEFIKEKGERKKSDQIVITTETFLAGRNLLNASDDSFAKNNHYDSLWARIDESVIPNGKPYVLYSSCPKELRNRVDVNSRDFDEWVKLHSTVEIKGHKIPFLNGRKEIELEAVSYEDSPRGDEKIYKYWEFHNNGFFEQGVTDPIVYDAHGDDRNLYALLHLCWLTGSFWAFLKFCKLYYDRIGMKESFDVFLSIRNSKDLMLMGFGGKPREDLKYIEPFKSEWYMKKPRTNRDNISLKIESLTVDQLTDEFIEKKVREISDKLSNAYGLESSRCYNYDGSFNFELMTFYR